MDPISSSDGGGACASKSNPGKQEDSASSDQRGRSTEGPVSNTAESKAPEPNVEPTNSRGVGNEAIAPSQEPSSSDNVERAGARGRLNMDALVAALLDPSEGTPEPRDMDACIHRLMVSGSALYTEFLRSGDTEGINGAIDHWTAAVSLSADSNMEKPRILSNLGCAYLALFERVGKLSDLEKSIESGMEAILLTPEGHGNKSGRLSNLGNSYRARFERLGELGDLNKAIECGARAVSLTDDGHADKPSMLNNLGNSYRTRFTRSDELEDLNKAIKYGVESVSLTAHGQASRPARLTNLGSTYWTRFTRFGDLVDLSMAIDCGTQAASLTPDSHELKPKTLSNLGILHNERFERLGELVDLNKAIEYGVRAVSLVPDGHADKPSRLNNLGNSYQTRFERLGDLADLNKAIECGSQASSLTPDDHAVKPGRLSNLGNSYLARFNRLGGLVDLNRAIDCGALAVLLTPDDHTAKPRFLSNLGNAYLGRFERLREPVDLDKAIDSEAQAVLLSPDDHADKPKWLSNLANSYRTRFTHFGEPVDLEKGIECGIRALSSIPDNHTDRPSILSNLGYSYWIRSLRFGELVDINSAIDYGEQAASLIPEGHANKPSRLSILGRSYQTRFEHLGRLEDLNKAIGCGAQAVLFTPDTHAEKSTFLRNLADAYNARFEHSHTISDLESSVGCYTHAARSFVGSPLSKFSACRNWAKLASSHPTTFSPLPAYQRAMELLPQLIWVGTTLERRYNLITEIGDFTTEAASYAIGIEDTSLALEWLEAGRSIVWGQISQLRTPFEQLSVHDLELANELKEISQRLESAGSRSSLLPAFENDGMSLEEEANHHIQLALDWERLLKKARAIPGLEGLLQTPKSTQLLGAATSHPVVVINVHKSRCDALILQPNSGIISHVPLTRLSVTSTLAARSHLASQVRQRKIIHLKSGGSLEASLGDLWHNVLKPILDFLGYTKRLSIDELPRITWCTTGLLSFLPLHAAGMYDGLENNALDLVVSSYTPTLSALLLKQPADPSAHCGILAVGQEYTEGFESLPSVKDELAAIERHACTGLYLQLENDEATVDQVLDAMEQFSWVHLACHGSQDTTDPTQSAFHLYDGNLTLSAITKRSFANKGLAFLSACQTATGDKGLPEEAVHLAAGMMMAGFPSVIGTMWSIADEDGPRVADRVYASLSNDGIMDYTNAARALHQAVAELRTIVGDTSIERWAPFIHIGI